MSIEKVVIPALQNQIGSDLLKVCKAIDDKEKPALFILAEESREDRELTIDYMLLQRRSIPVMQFLELLDHGRLIDHYDIYIHTMKNEN